MKKNNDEYLDFLTSRELPPLSLSSAVKKDISLSFRGNSILLKFFFFQILGCLFSMSVCPQFSLGLIDGHGITHVFRMIGDWACAFFCGSLFLSCGVLLSYISMKGDELWWIWQRHKVCVILLPPLFWGGLMLTNFTLDLPKETISYNMIWIISAIIVQISGMQIRSWRVGRNLH